MNAKDDIETKEAQLETHSNSEIKTISEHKKQTADYSTHHCIM